jgi:hypothetical protein
MIQKDQGQWQFLVYDLSRSHASTSKKRTSTFKEAASLFSKLYSSLNICKPMPPKAIIGSTLRIEQRIQNKLQRKEEKKRKVGKKRKQRKQPAQ